MSGETPRLRMFAGPNGSGKSVLKSYLPAVLLGAYLNPDEIESRVKERGFLDLAPFEVSTTAGEVLPMLTGSEFLVKEGLQEAGRSVGYSDGRLIFPSGVMNSYFASVLAEFLRLKLLSVGKDFTFETVMSHPGKVEFLQKAQQAGYRTYLYFVATEDPAINVSRVANRVRLGGHAVPEAKIVDRYYKSLDLLLSAIRCTNRAYVFDNSTHNADGSHTWLAEITEGKTLEVKTDRIPRWFQRAVLDKIQ